jgi:DMSO/TMAO reductase YedYZ molybdopterin-dependent catalytic subunit
MLTHDDKYQPGNARPPETLPADVIISPDTRRDNRIPPGQTRTRKWPVLQYGHVPTVPIDRWRLDVRGLVTTPLTFSWDEFQALPRVKVYADFHCVTTWSRLDNVWEGVAVREILHRAGVRLEAKFVIAHGYDSGFTTNMPLIDFNAEDALLADTHDGQPLTADHGGPVRLIVPRLYAWKSAKWLKALEFVATDRPGLWEQVGYHNHGDPWTEERMW